MEENNINDEKWAFPKHRSYFDQDNKVLTPRDEFYRVIYITLSKGIDSIVKEDIGASDLEWTINLEIFPATLLESKLNVDTATCKDLIDFINMYGANICDKICNATKYWFEGNNTQELRYKVLRDDKELLKNLNTLYKEDLIENDGHSFHLNIYKSIFDMRKFKIDS